jgi:hypothetical protein
MSDRDFDNYLTLLASLLRLDPKQRQSISQELRSHLEDRLDELTAQGISHNDAIKQALAEFGDAAGLAGQFVALSQNRKRRWLMRMTTFSIAATLLVAASLALLWPARNAAPGLAAVVAQAPPAADPFAAQPTTPSPPEPDPFAAPPPALGPKLDTPPAKKGPSSAVSRITNELEKFTNIDVVEMPLRDVVAYLSEMHGIPILLKAKKLEEASISTDTPITKSLRGIRLSSALNLILEDLEGAYVVKDEVLQLTTLKDAQSMMEIRIYDCRDILAIPAPGAPGVGNAPFRMAPGGGEMAPVSKHDHRAQQLMTIITTNVDPHTWQGAHGSFAGGGYGAGMPGGELQTAAASSSGGSVSEYSGLIVVTQTAQTHEKIKHVLEMLRTAAGLDPPTTSKVFP